MGVTGHASNLLQGGILTVSSDMTASSAIPVGSVTPRSGNSSAPSTNQLAVRSASPVSLWFTPR